jgi:hypothetical protein
MKSLLLDLGLKHHLIVQRKLAKRVIEAMALGRRQVSGVKNVNAQASHVVDTLRRVKLHLDWNITSADSNLADFIIIRAKGKLGVYLCTLSVILFHKGEIDFTRIYQNPLQSSQGVSSCLAAVLSSLSSLESFFATRQE